jgi:choline dehydrogenase-like flavoprotein
MTGSPTIVRTDICVVGTGAGGGILAYRLALSGRDVLSLEQGGPITSDYFTNELNPEDETNLGIAAEMPWDMNPAQSFYFSNAQAHALYAREDELSTSAAAKQSFINMQIFRMNGKMNLWSAVSLRYSPRDFRGKDHGDSDFNWPIDYEVLAPHYGAVERLFGCAAGSVYKFSTHLLPQIANRSNYRLLYGIKVLRLIRDPRSNRIEAAKCLDTATGQIVRVEANLFVLSCGAMETPRVLFNSRDDDFPNGLANSSGLLGCFLQDTVKVILGTSLWKLVGSKIKYDQGTNDAMLIPRFLFGGEEFRGGYQGQFSHFLPKRPYYLDALGPLPAWIKPFTARLLFKSYVALLFFGKPEALKSNRLLAGQACDKYGIPQVDVQYTPTRNDLLMKQSMMEWGRRILRRCSGTSITTFTEPTPGRSIHYAGTCRMAANRADGVVDANLRSFDHPNLYVCDGSVLPEVSEKNLTLTIMALAERLSQNLKT